MTMIIRKERKSRVTAFHFEADSPAEMREAVLRLETMKRFGMLPSDCETPPRGDGSVKAVLKMKTAEADRRRMFVSYEVDDEEFLRWPDMEVGQGRKGVNFPARPAIVDWAADAVKWAAHGRIKSVQCEGSIVWIGFGFDYRYASMCGDWFDAGSPTEADALFGSIHGEIKERKERKDDYGELRDAVRSAAGHSSTSGDDSYREVEVSVDLFPKPETGDRNYDSEDFKVVLGDVDAPAFVGRPSADGEGNGTVVIPRKALPKRVEIEPNQYRIIGGDEFKKVVKDAIEEYKGMFYAPRPLDGRPFLDEDERAVDDYLKMCRRGGSGEVDWERFLGYMRAELGADADAYLELSRRRGEGE